MMCWCAVKKLLTHSLTHSAESVCFNAVKAVVECESCILVWNYRMCSSFTQQQTERIYWLHYCVMVKTTASLWPRSHLRISILTDPSVSSKQETSGYATMVHGRGCNPHRCTTTFANLEITSLWRHNSETIRDRQKWRPHRRMKSSDLSNGENRIALWQLLQNRKLRHWWRHNLGSRWKLQKNGSREF